MKTIRLCPGCGTPLTADAPAELCPQCLLRSGIHTQVEALDGSAPRVPTPGEVFGPYRILRLLGHGGMGRVFEAEHVETGRRVALKVMGQTLASEQDRKRFLREGRLAASVNHPNVVYIHGSEEIEGVPIIAMELVHGGTLKDRLREGPLSITEAITSALQIVDGLEAANAAGVLHRDIKPANCFVSSDGSVKVGDFGLSVSTLARGESLLTATGAVMGTPAYASPEQLRGEELDVRSDIYSVGATLYHLLTGKTPFGATDFVKLITEVLDKDPANPRAHRREIPTDLARVVLRCLAKDRKARFQSYAELRDALLPFRTAEVTPARPAVRFLAGLVDDFIAYMPSMLFIAYWSYDPIEEFARTRAPSVLLVWFTFYAIYMLYYAILEGLWGAGIGKTLCGLRVVNERRESPGIARAALRAFIYALPFTLPGILYATFTSAERVRASMQSGDAVLPDWLWIPLTILLFSTMRARNGFAAIHDRLSGTRVIVRPRSEPRPQLEMPAQGTPDLVAHAESPRRFGPYEVTGTLWKTNESELLQALDPVLRRKVWVHLTAATAPLSDARRDVSRATRLRWIDGGQVNDTSWNAYDALDGAPFLSVAEARQSWRAVRFWLLDIAEEADACAQDADAGMTLALDRLWITAKGQAVILDFTAPGVTTIQFQGSVSDCRDAKAVQHFMASVARLSLDDKSRRQSERGLVQAAVPLHARTFLNSIAQATFDQIRYIVGNLRSLVAKPAEVTRARRAATMAFVPAIAFGFGALIAAIVIFERVRWDRVWAATYPGEPSLRRAAELYFDNSPGSKGFAFDKKEFETIGTYIAKHFAPVTTNEVFWDAQPTLTFLPDMREIVSEAVTKFSSADAPAVEEAERTVSKRLEKFERTERLAFLRAGAVTMAGILWGAAIIGCICALTFSISPVLRLFAIAVVNGNGDRASRGRMLWRALLGWVPAVAIVSFIAALVDSVTTNDPLLSLPADLAMLLLLSLAGVAAFVFGLGCPSAGLPDRAAGTRLVPM